jgi:hypothetical protein
LPFKVDLLQGVPADILAVYIIYIIIFKIILNFRRREIMWETIMGGGH